MKATLEQYLKDDSNPLGTAVPTDLRGMIVESLIAAIQSGKTDMASEFIFQQLGISSEDAAAVRINYSQRWLKLP